MDHSLELVGNLQRDIHTYLTKEIKQDEVTGQTPRKRRVLGEEEDEAEVEDEEDEEVEEDGAEAEVLVQERERDEENRVEAEESCLKPFKRQRSTSASSWGGGGGAAIKLRATNQGILRDKANQSLQRK